MGAAAVTGCVWLLCRGVWLCQGMDVAAVAGKRCLELLLQHCAWCRRGRRTAPPQGITPLSLYDDVAQERRQSRLLAAGHRLNLSHSKYYLQNRHLLKFQKPF